MVTAPGNERNSLVNGLVWLQQWAADLVGLPRPPDWAAILLAFLIVAFALVNVVFVVGGLFSYVMRKVMARVQTRIGPNRVGPFGLLQFLADGLKMMSKESPIPAKADAWGFRIAPFLILIPAVLAFAPLPFGNGILLSNLGVGILFILAIAAITPIGEIVAGWASNNKYSMMGALRAAALDVSYEIPMVLAAVGVVVLAGSLSTLDIVEAQRGAWFVLLQPLGALIFFAAALAKAGVVPMDLAEAESELVSGFMTEYGGMRFGIIQMTIFANVVFISALTVLLFFGGWTVPFMGVPIAALGGIVIIPEWTGPLWFLLKVAFFTLFVVLTWFTLPRVRIDQFLALGWKVLFPLSLLNLMLAVAQIYVLKGGLF